MNPEISEKVRGWVEEEIEAMRVKGATEEDVAEPAFARLLTNLILSKHAGEINETPELSRFLMAEAFENASPEVFRDIAAKLREKGNFDAAYLFETYADRCERGER